MRRKKLTILNKLTEILRNKKICFENKNRETANFVYSLKLKKLNKYVNKKRKRK